MEFKWHLRFCKFMDAQICCSIIVCTSLGPLLMALSSPLDVTNESSPMAYSETAGLTKGWISGISFDLGLISWTFCWTGQGRFFGSNLGITIAGGIFGGFDIPRRWYMRIDSAQGFASDVTLWALGTGGVLGSPWLLAFLAGLLTVWSAPFAFVRQSPDHLFLWLVSILIWLGQYVLYNSEEPKT